MQEFLPLSHKFSMGVTLSPRGQILALRSEKIFFFVCIKHRYIDSTQTNGGGIRGKKCLKRLFRGKVIIKKKRLINTSLGLLMSIGDTQMPWNCNKIHFTTEKVCGFFQFLKGLHGKGEKPCHRRFLVCVALSATNVLQQLFLRDSQPRGAERSNLGRTGDPTLGRRSRAQGSFPHL